VARANAPTWEQQYTKPRLDGREFTANRSVEAAMAKPKRPQRPLARPQNSGAIKKPTVGAAPIATNVTRAANSANATGATGAGAIGGGAKSLALSGASAQPSRLAGIRERAPAPRAMQQRRRYAQAPWWKGTWGVVSAVGVFVLLIAVFIYIAYSQAQASAVGIGSSVPSSVINEVTHVSPSVFSNVGAGPNPNQMIGLPPSTPTLTANGHPEIIYVGAEYCPYCAAQRWSLVVALSRFGTFTNLHLMKSSHTDAYPDTNTLTFYKSTYTSKYIVFAPDEMQDRNQGTLQTPTAQQQQVFSTYDNTPYTQSPQSYPFVDYGGYYITIGGAYLPTNLQGVSWQTIAAGLGDSTNAATQDIIGTANQMTAAICLMDHQQPGSVCQLSTIQALEKKMPVRK